MKNQFNLTQIKALIEKGASIEIYDNNYTANSLFELAKAAGTKGVQLKIHVRNSEMEDLIHILKDVGKESVTFVFD